MEQMPLNSKFDFFAGRFRLPRSIWMHSYSALPKSLRHHPQVPEHKHGEDLRLVYLQSTVANAGVTKLATVKIA
jgi:hypothetical protein